MDFPTFHGRNDENGCDFVDSFELSCLLIGREDPLFLARLFPLSLRGEAKEWYNHSKFIQHEWTALKEVFLARFSPKPTVEDLWKRLQELHQDDLRGYNSYERSFLGILMQLQTSWEGGGKVPDMFIRETFLDGLVETLQEKVRCKFPSTFEEAIQIARAKYRKLMYPLVKLGIVSEVLPSQAPYEFCSRHTSFPGCVTTKTKPCRVERPQLHVEDSSKTFSNQSLVQVSLPESAEEEEFAKEVVLEEVDIDLDRGEVSKEEQR